MRGCEVCEVSRGPGSEGARSEGYNYVELRRGLRRRRSQLKCRCRTQRAFVRLSRRTRSASLMYFSVTRVAQMILALVQRATSHIQETSEIRVGTPAESFRNIPRCRCGGISKLVPELKVRLEARSLQETIDFKL